MSERGWRENVRGLCPDYMRGTARKVFVELRNGTKPAEPWPADTGRYRANTNWALSGSGWDIMKWKEAK